ncbi:MAG TPA: hypothetical protein VMU16_09570 [Candidatus Binataceae bacterium]|nr:hypothetical protein [Candidatus Binataceae bacterium]
MVNRVRVRGRLAAIALAAVVGFCIPKAEIHAANPPWYPSVAAFEHYDSGRTHLFAKARFGGNYAGGNTVTTLATNPSYPSAWNITYLNANNAFLDGGGSGGAASSIGAYVAKINPKTLNPIWYDQLDYAVQTGEWDYPGTMAIMKDGFIYVIYGYRLSKIDPSGKVIATLILPTGGAAPADTAYNGFSAASDGTIVAKSFYRQAGCTIQGPNALSECPDPSDVPNSIAVTIDPHAMKVIEQTTLPADIIGRVTVGKYKGQEYAYFFSVNTFIRYKINAGHLTLDSSWNPGPLLVSGQTAGWAAVLINDWVVGQCNGLPASTAMSVFAVNQGDASNQFSMQPFAGDPIPPLVLAAFSKQGPGGTQAISWNAATVSADPDTNLIYAMDALPGKVAALRIGSSGLETVWTADQTTTEWIAIIGPRGKRVIVGSDIPGAEIPDINTEDEVVWRNAATGQEIARSPRLPKMTSGTMIQPDYFGNVFYPGEAGTLYKLQPSPSGSR